MEKHQTGNLRSPLKDAKQKIVDFETKTVSKVKLIQIVKASVT